MILIDSFNQSGRLIKNQAAMNRNVRLLQLHAILLNGLFILPVLVPFYKDEIGLGFREFIIGEALFSFVMIMMEVPSGWLSDIWTRKRTLMVGSLVEVLGWILLLSADSFGDTLMAQALLGVAVSLFSGTNSSMLYDSLLSINKQGMFRKLDGLRQGSGLYACGIAAIIGGFLYEIDHTLPLIVTAVFSGLAFIATLFLTEPERHKKAAEKHPIADMLETMRYALRGHIEVAGIILFSAALFATTKTLMWTQQPYYEALALPEKWFGILMACGLLLAGAGSHLGHHLDGKGGNIKIIAICFVVVFCAALTAGITMSVWTIPLLLIGSPIWGFTMPRLQDAIHKRVGSERRATILSTASLMVHCGSVPLMIMIGLVQDGYGIDRALITLAFIMAAVGGIGFSLIRRKAGHLFTL